jgi:alkylation response protein AidB-like acyl-CoA dehydrogenase
VDFELSADQVALRDELRRALATACSSDVRRAAIDRPGAVDRSLWQTLAGLGVFGLCLPEDAGGVGLGRADATIVVEELGRALVPGPVIATFLAAGVVDGAAAGSVVVGAVDRAVPLVVEHLDALDVLVVTEGDGLATVDPKELGASALPQPFDPLTPVHLASEGAPGGTALAADTGVWSRDGSLLVAAFQVGLAAAALDLAVDYAKQRKQFGRPIGSFQALKHMMADVFCETETARAAVQSAGVQIDEDALADEVGRAVAGARLLASHAARQSANTCIQVHGGMGFTWELDAHLYLKRTIVLDSQFGGVEQAEVDMAAALA